jgi:hypothetical protein
MEIQELSLTLLKRKANGKVRGSWLILLPRHLGARALPASPQSALRKPLSCHLQRIRIGRVTTSQKAAVEGGAKVIYFENRTDVEASFLWMNYCHDSCEKATIRDGKLLTYSRTEKINGKDIKVEGRLVGD